MTRTMTWTSRAAPPFPRRPSRPRSRPPPPPRLPRLRHPSMFSQSFLRGVATPPRGRATRLAPRPAWPSARRRPRARLRRGSNPRPPVCPLARLRRVANPWRRRGRRRRYFRRSPRSSAPSCSSPTPRARRRARWNARTRTPTRWVSSPPVGATRASRTRVSFSRGP